VAPYVISCGVPERLERIIKHVSEPHLFFEHLLMKAYRGKIDGIPVTVASLGVGSPDASIATELYFAAGGECLIRVGSAGSLWKNLKIGDIVIATGAVRDEGTSGQYVPKEYPAVPDPTLTDSLMEAARKLDVPFERGIVWTTDAIFRETPEKISFWRSAGVKCVDMICSSLFVISQIYGKRAGAILAISDNLETNEEGFKSEEFRNAEARAAQIAVESIKILDKKFRMI
jgi:uridine phosphorylase